MPIYEYDCPECGRTFEKRASIAEADHAVCPHCANEYPRRRLSRVNVKVQGSNRSAAPVSISTGGG